MFAGDQAGKGGNDGVGTSGQMGVSASHIASAHLCRSASVAVVEGCRRPRPPSGKEEAGGGAGSWHGHRPGADDPPPFRPFPPSGPGVSRGVRGGIRGREVGACALTLASCGQRETPKFGARTPPFRGNTKSQTSF